MPRTIHLYNRQRAIRLDLPWLKTVATQALTQCEGEGITPGNPLETLQEIEVSIVSDKTIAAVHKRFMNIPGATDIITFDHGELIISAQTAARQAADHKTPLHHELALYIIHGILHLNGHDDLAEPAATRMRATQETILRRVLSAME